MFDNIVKFSILKSVNILRFSLQSLSIYELERTDTDNNVLIFHIDRHVLVPTLTPTVSDRTCFFPW